MTNTVTYNFAQIFNYDPTSNEIIETRTVKRNIQENSNDECIQILKAKTKRYNTIDVPESLNAVVEKAGMISFNVGVTKEQVENFMQKSFDLFNFDINEEIKNTLKNIH